MQNKHLGLELKKHIQRVPNIDFVLDNTLDEMYRLNNLFYEFLP
ncbi:hypothetical protein [Membranihabitans marinus]|nr:hypothetical protein [Membranihabitans marinus]